jgi:hypothetical protein
VTTPDEELPFAFKALLIGLGTLLLGALLIINPYVGPTETEPGWLIMALIAIWLSSGALAAGRHVWQLRAW